MIFNQLHPYELPDFSIIFFHVQLQRTSKCSPPLHEDQHVQSDNATMLTAAVRQNRDEPCEVHGPSRHFFCGCFLPIITPSKTSMAIEFRNLSGKSWSLYNQDL